MTSLTGCLDKYIIQIQKIFVKPYLFFDNIIYLPRELGDVLFTKSGHLTEEVKFMSDYETFMIILTVANLIVAILTYAHKK